MPQRRTRTSWRTWAACALLSFQLVCIVRARFVAARYFCWAPYDAINVFTLQVELGGQRLGRAAVDHRYHLPRRRDNRSIQHVIDIVSQVERTYGRDDSARVRLRYTTNGGALQEWSWPVD